MDSTDLAFDLPADVVLALYDRAGAATWNLPRDRFAAALGRSCAHRFSDEPAPEAPAVRAYLEGLHVRDLALACACRDGSEAAWDAFLRDVHPRVRAAAIAMAGASGDELADTLLADLYGTTSRDGNRRSLLDYFHGRSQLSTWLRTVLAQRHVDTLRRQRREISLEAALSGPERESGSPAREVVATPDGVGIDHRCVTRGADDDVARELDRAKVLTAFHRAVQTAVCALPADTRLRLAAYYVQGLTLAQVGRLMGEHESSVSRKLDRARRDLREQVERTLREQHRFSDADLAQCYEEAPKMGAVDIGALIEGSGLRAQGSGGLEAQDSGLKAPGSGIQAPGVIRLRAGAADERKI